MNSLLLKIREFSSRSPGAIALVDCHSDQGVTFAELVSFVDGFVEALARFGVSEGDRVALIAPEGVAGVVTFLAIGAIGAIGVPVPEPCSAATISHIVDEAHVTFTVSSQHVDMPLDVSTLTEVNHVSIRGTAISVSSLRTLRDSSAFDEWRCPSGTALVVYTSGSTDLPKGVMLTHSNLEAAAASMAEVVGASSGMRVLVPVALSHMYGLISTMTHLSRGGTVYLVSAHVDARLLLGFIRKYGIEGLPFQPRHLTALLGEEAEVRSIGRMVRYISSASSSLDPSDISRVATVMPNATIVIYYALTEAPRAVCVVDPHLLPESQRGTVGRAAPGMSAYVLGFNGSAASAGELGEIVLEGPTVAAGYIGRPRSPTNPFDGCRFRTGDLGVVDSDGFLYWRGRISDLIRWRGAVLNPWELEKVLESYDGVSSASIVLEVFEDASSAVLVVVLECVDEPVLDLPALERLVRYETTHLDVAVEVHVLSSVPRTSNGKVIRKRILDAVRRAGK